MDKHRTEILNQRMVEQKINRIAFQVIEEHYDQKEIIMAGILGNGHTLAGLIAKKVTANSSIDVHLIELTLNKKDPLHSKIELNTSEVNMEGACIILIDDVLNSGRTMMYAMKAFLDSSIRSLKTAVLVNRSHNRYPVHANYVGMSLATTLKEHIEVVLEKDNYGAYLV